MELYKARCIVQGHKYKEIHHTLIKIVRHKNIKILISLAFSYILKAWDQHVKKKYIHAIHMEIDLFVNQTKDLDYQYKRYSNFLNLYMDLQNQETTVMISIHHF